MSRTTVAVGPGEQPLLEQAVREAGAEPAGLDEARALIWNGPPAQFPDRLPEGLAWVQLNAAGVEDWFDAGVFERFPGLRFTSAAGAYAASVAEHTLMLLLAGVRYLP
ncbi:hydroxyacid dehydrogenase, partial [Nocardia cyriacigeorgica]|nr:hydroxyacid dehydrogenase [Nocardia cyriacigeorgica]